MANDKNTKSIMDVKNIINTLDSYINNMLNGSIVSSGKNFTEQYSNAGNLNKLITKINGEALKSYVNQSLSTVSIPIKMSDGIHNINVTIGKEVPNSDSSYFKLGTNLYDAKDEIYKRLEKDEGIQIPKHGNDAGVTGFVKGSAGYENYKKAGQKKLSAIFKDGNSRFGCGDNVASAGSAKFNDSEMNTKSQFSDTKEKFNIDGTFFSSDDIENIGHEIMKLQREKFATAGWHGNIANAQAVPGDVTIISLASTKDSTTTNDTWGSYYSDDQMFAKLSHDMSWFGDVAEAVIGATGVVSGVAALIGAQTMTSWENPYINFFNGMAREFNRDPGKVLKWVAYQTILTSMNPNIRNVDSNIDNALFGFLGAIGGQSNFAKESVGKITSRAGPSLLSWLPDMGAYAAGKGKIFNPMKLASGGGLMMGEAWIPLVTTPFLDGPFSAVTTGQELNSAISNFSEWADELEPKLSISLKENPKHADKGGGDVNSRVLETVAKNKLSMRNLPSTDTGVVYHLDIKKFGELQDEADKLYSEGKTSKAVSKYEEASTVLAKTSVEDIEKLLDAEYCPFYFHDLRTNEITSFHAFLTSIGQNFSPKWNQEDYYGRSDAIPTLQGTSRTINLSFVVAAMNPDDFDVMYKKVNKLLTLLYPQYNNGEKTFGDNGKLIPFSQIPIGDPIIRLRVGDYIKTNYSYSDLRAITLDESDTQSKDENRFHINFKKYGGKGLAGYITSFDIDVASAVWETAKYHVAPKMMVITVGFTAIHDINPGISFNGRNRAPIFNVRSKNHPHDTTEKSETLYDSLSSWTDSSQQGKYSKNQRYK